MFMLVGLIAVLLMRWLTVLIIPVMAWYGVCAVAFFTGDREALGVAMFAGIPVAGAVYYLLIEGIVRLPLVWSRIIVALVIVPPSIFATRWTHLVAAGNVPVVWDYLGSLAVGGWGGWLAFGNLLDRCENHIAGPPVLVRIINS